MRLAYWASMAVFGVVALASVAYVGSVAVLAVQEFSAGPATPGLRLALMSVVWVALQAALPALVCLGLWKLTRAARRRVA